MKILIEINYESIRNDVLRIENSGRFSFNQIMSIITLLVYIQRSTSSAERRRSGMQLKLLGYLETMYLNSNLG